MMRLRLVDALATLLLFFSLYLFYAAVAALSERDYVAGLLEIAVGLSLIRSGIELEKLALVERSRGK